MAKDKLVYKLSADSTSFKKELRDASKSLESFGKVHKKGIGQLKSAGLSAASGIAAVGTAAVAAGVALSVKATKAAASFERAIVSAGAKSSATATQLDKMGKAALAAASGAEFSAQQAADAMGFLAAAGFSVAEQMEALPGVLNLASAGELELAESADIASNVLSQFALDVEELARVNDVMVLAANSSNTSVYQLGEALSFAGPAAAGAGISLEETVAAIGKLSDAGIQGGRAGSGLVQIMIQLTSAAKKMNVPLDGAEIASLGLAGSLQKLSDAGLNAQNAGEFFTSRAQVAVQAILQQGIPAVQGLDKALQNAGGTAQEVADKKIDTLQGAINILQGNIDNLMISLGEKFTGAVKDLSTSFATFTSDLQNNDAALQKFADGMADLIVITAGVTQAMGYLGSVVVRVMGALSGNFAKGNEAANKLNAALEKGVDMAAQFSAQIKTSGDNVSALAVKELELNRQLIEGNNTIGDRIRLERELNKTQNAIRIEQLRSQAELADDLEKQSKKELQRLSDVLAVRKEIEDIGKGAGLNFVALESLSALPKDMPVDQRKQLEQYREAWIQINAEVSKTRGNLDGIDRELDAALSAREKLAKLEGDKSPVITKTKSQVVQPPPAVAEEIVKASLGGDNAEEIAKRLGRDQAGSLISGIQERMQEADANDIFAGYDRKMFEERNARLAAEMADMIAEQEALAQKWQDIWDSASDKVVSVFADSVGDAFLGVLEGNVDAVKNAVKSLIKEMVILAAKAAILSAFQSASPGAAIPSALGFASGGYVSGPGTSTSDSIAARLSNGEYVINASAVRAHGVGFMDMINRTKGRPRGRTPRFADGGLVGGGGESVRIVNVIDPSEIESAMASSAGERVIINTISRRSTEIKRVLA